jgi:hypothetical protein
VYENYEAVYISLLLLATFLTGIESYTILPVELTKNDKGSMASFVSPMMPIRSNTSTDQATVTTGNVPCKYIVGDCSGENDSLLESVLEGRQGLSPASVLYAGPVESSLNSKQTHLGLIHTLVCINPDNIRKEFIEFGNIIRTENKLLRERSSKNQLDEVNLFNKLFRIEKLQSLAANLNETILSTCILDLKSKSGWKNLNSDVLLQILVIGQEDQLTNFILSKFNEYMALQVLMLIAPKILTNNSYHSWTWVHILSQCVRCDTYDEGRRTLIKVFGTLINRTDSWFPTASILEIWGIAVQDYLGGYEGVRDFTMSQLNDLNGEVFLGTREQIEKINGQLQILMWMYRDDSRVKASGCQCQTPLIAKEANNSVSVKSTDPNLKSNRLVDSDLKVIRQYYQTLHVESEVECLPSVTAAVNLQPSEVKTFGFGGITAEVVKDLKTPEQGSYFCFQAIGLAKSPITTSSSRTKKWLTYQFVDGGTQTDNEDNDENDSEDHDDNNDDDDEDDGGVSVGMCDLTNNYLVLRSKIMRWEVRRKRSSVGSNKMAKLKKDGAVEKLLEEYNHITKGFVSEPSEVGNRYKEDFKSMESMGERPADWENWKKKKKD